MRTIFIGDVHGCFDELQLLLKKLDFQREDDRLIFVGDLINKGPNSLAVLKFVISEKFECVIGNHEWGFLKAIDDFEKSKKRYAELYGEMGADREKIIQWMRSLPLYIEDESFICIHGGLEPKTTLSNQRAEIATRIRSWGGDLNDLDNENDPPWYHFYDESRPVIFGHWALKGLVREKNVIGLDSGCVYGGELSAYILEEDRIVQVSALREYRKV